MNELSNLTHFRRYLWEEPNLLVVTGKIDPVIQGFELYNTRYNIKGPGSSISPLFERLLNATSLAAVSLAERESWGWTFTLPDSSYGFFVGIEPEGMICGRIQESDPQNRVAIVQRQKTKEPIRESRFEVPDRDPVRLVQRYFEDVEQIRTRLAVREDGLGVLVQALPGGRLDHISDVDDNHFIEHIFQMTLQDKMVQLGEVIIFYECRCHDSMILDMINNLQEDHRTELWGDLKELEIECPRCGRTYIVTKNMQCGEC